MGELGTQALAAAIRSLGIRTTALPPADREALTLGRGATNCKECLPLQLTVGSLLEYVERRSRDGEVLIYFMPESTGPCRFGQYNVFIKRLIEQQRIPDLCVVPLGDADCYAGLGSTFISRAWQAVTAADVMNEVRSAVQALAVDRQAGLALFDEAWRLVLAALARENGASVARALSAASEILATHDHIPRSHGGSKASIDILHAVRGQFPGGGYVQIARGDYGVGIHVIAVFPDSTLYGH